MTTGSGLVHSELVTDKFKKNGGVMQGLQIWVNLPQKNKKVKPWYQHIKRNDIPTINESNDVSVKVLVGKVKKISSAVTQIDADNAVGFIGADLGINHAVRNAK